MKTTWLACLALTLGACPSVTVDQNDEPVGPTVEFDPANKIIPFPNNLLLDPETGKVNLPEQCNESAASAATRTLVLNKLDGFGTYETAINVTFTEPVDMASLAGHVLVYERKTFGVANDPLTATPIPDAGLVLIPGKSTRFANQSDITACTDPVMVDQVTIISRAPLKQKSTYTVALLDGIKTATGAAFIPSFTWNLIRQPDPVVVFDDAGNVISNRTPLDPLSAGGLAQLQGLDLLFKTHQDAFTFLAGAGHDRDTLLLAFDFTTQTITDALDPAIAGSPASTPTALPLLGNSNAGTTQNPAVVNRLGPFAACANSDNDTECFLKVTLGGGVYAVGDAICASLGCANVGDVLGSLLVSKQYTSDTTNAYTDPNLPANLPIPGQWSDPYAPTVVHDTAGFNPSAADLGLPAQTKIEVLVFLPATAAPANGYPTVIFQHGIGQSKTNVFAVGSQLAGAGFATVAIDIIFHDSRAVRISNTANADPKKTCADAAGSRRADKGPDPVKFSHCYAPVLPGDLGAQRDAVRQTVLDQQQLITSLKICGTTNCGALKVDPAHIVYLGHSLGSIVGSITAALRSDIKAAVLDVSGVGVVDILTGTKSQAISCGLVDGLIGAGVLVGDKSVDADSDGIPESGLCMTDAWKTQPAFQPFSVIYRWVIDPGDPANYTSRLATKKFLIQEVVDDEVVPNNATDNEGALVGLAPGLTADPFVGGAASAAITTNPTASKFVKYPFLAPNAGAGFPGNTFDHGTLLTPAETPGTTTVGNDGKLGTGRIQKDAFTFLVINK